MHLYSLLFLGRENDIDATRERNIEGVKHPKSKLAFPNMNERILSSTSDVV